jgi:hypothetical protein
MQLGKEEKAHRLQLTSVVIPGNHNLFMYPNHCYSKSSRSLEKRFIPFEERMKMK